MIWSLGLIALGGMLGSSHCVGMCGGFAVMLGLGQTGFRQNLQRQCVYSVGRIVSYCTLGAVAGYAGNSLAERLPGIVNVPAVLSLLAGMFLIWQGLDSAGLLQRSSRGLLGGACLYGSLFATLLRRPALQNALSAGVLTGLLPCGLVYAFTSLAASSGDMIMGLLIMAAFGMGTMPLMILTGTGAMLLGVSARRRLWQIAAWSVIATGVLTVGRGIAAIRTAEQGSAAGCPFCTKQSDTSVMLSPWLL